MEPQDGEGRVQSIKEKGAGGTSKGSRDFSPGLSCFQERQWEGADREGHAFRIALDDLPICDSSIGNKSI